MSKKLKYITIFSLIPQYLVLLILKNKPGFVENYYSTGLYPIISKLLTTAQKVPSWCNAQPWQVQILSGGSLLTLKNLALKNAKSGMAPILTE